MKKIISVILLLWLLVFNFQAFAQDKQESDQEKMPVRNGFLINLPGMTDAQKEELSKARIEHQKLARQLHASLQEQRAHLNTLRLADKPDVDAINRTIDEIAATQAKIMKARESHLIEMRSKLNEEQKDWFDSRHQKRGFGKGRFNGNGPCCKRGPCWNNNDDDDSDDFDNSNRFKNRPPRINR